MQGDCVMYWHIMGYFSSEPPPQALVLLDSSGMDCCTVQLSLYYDGILQRSAICGVCICYLPNNTWMHMHMHGPCNGSPDDLNRPHHYGHVVM